jgi:glutathione S-transferase
MAATKESGTMILIGQYDSPFTRRVGIALTLYGLPFEHRPWSIFADADQIRPFNPLTRVPTLVLDDGEVLIESHLILDYLDSLMPAERRLFPAAEPARRRALRVAALATGMADKGVSLFYEKALHAEVSEAWAGRCRMQIRSTLAILEADRADRRGGYWFGPAIGHADIAVAVALRFLADVHPDLMTQAAIPALKAHAARLESLPAFQRISQPFVPPT